MEGKDNRLVFGEERVELSVAQAVGMLASWLQLIRSTTLITRILSSGK